MRKISFILTHVALLSPLFAAAGGERDSSLVRQMQYRDYNYVHNIENGSLNPVSVSRVAVPELAIVGVGYNWANGGFHAVDESGHTNGLKVDAYGIKRMERLSFEGGIAYFNEKERSRCWNSTLYQSKLNPFVLADSEPSDYDTERFRIDGRVAYSLSDAFRIGINADYRVGVMSDEKDPRLETKGMRFIINPGVQWSITHNLAVGATGGLNLFNESLHYSSLATAVNYPFYAMSGLGTYYPQSGASYTRDSKGTSWFAGADVRYNFSESVADYLSVIYENENEHSTDGGSTYQFKAGEYMNGAFKFANRLSLNFGRTSHNIELSAQMNDVKGRWFDQKSVTVNGTTHYEVMGSSIKHKETLLNGKVSYRFDRLDNNGVSDLSAGVSAGYISSDTKNFPEVYFRKYSRLNVAANIMKYFNIRKVRLGAGIDGSYDMCLSSSCDFKGLDLEKLYSMPMYAYLTSSSFAVNGRVEAYFPIRDFVIGAYVAGGMSRCTGGKTEMYKNESMSSVNCGLTFSF